MSAVIKRMYSVQKQLNPYANFPYDDERALDRCVRALNREVDEALAECVPTWGWWPGKDDGKVDRDALRGEIVDCWFFTLTLFELAERNGFESDTLFGRVGLDEISKLQQKVAPYRNNFDHIQAELHTLDMYSKPMGEWGPQQLVRIFSQLLTITFMAGINLIELEDGYYRKALTNLERWGATESEIYQVVQDRCPEMASE